jgi:hypothetical protein
VARKSRYRTLLLAALSLVYLALGAVSVSARPPTLLSVGHTEHHLTATWSLPAGGAASVLEVADSASTGSDGSFFTERTKMYEGLADSQTSFTATRTLEPGTYYVHVAASDRACTTCPYQEWSSLQSLTIPTFLAVSVEGSGEVEAEGVACDQAACPYIDLAPGRTTLYATPAGGWIVADWSVDSADPSGSTCTIARSTCTVTVSADEGATVTARFERKPRTALTARLYAYDCLREIDVSNLGVRPYLDSSRPFTGVLTVRLRGPHGWVATRRFRDTGGDYPSPSFRRRQPGRYVLNATYAGDPWRAKQTIQRTIALDSC